ncbi:MAG: sodium:solute symporter family protein [Thermoguttaceae bacterium]
MQVQLGFIDYALLAIYVIFVLGIGFALKRSMKTSADFFMSGRSIPAWITGLAFMSANLGALELVGMAASGAKYGVATSHFYWVGAIPAMIFLAVFMMPFYYGSKARSVPEYLNMRFDARIRCLNSISFAVMTVFASGISMDALSRLLNQLLGWNYHISLWICSAVVLVYVLKGGLTSAIYTEVLQFFMIVLGFAPVVYLGMKDVGGWDVLKSHLAVVAQDPGKIGLPAPAGHVFADNAWTSAWQPLIAGPAHNPMGVDLFAMVFGLGFVLSFGYWCTNFLVVQRAMAARNMTAARRTPLIAAVPKMLLPALVILPGMLAAALATMPSKDYHLPPKLVEVTEKVSAAIHDAGKLDAKQGVELVSKAVGAKLDEAKAAALIKDASKLNEKDLQKQLQAAVVDNDYNNVILSLVTRYCPSGLLGLALTALLASFMSGMAGNVTAFNTVWTYDLYQAYIVPNKSDAHYMWMGRVVTVVGILLSIACAYFARNYDNAMDVIQLVFGFVNAPLFATFLLGMFWSGTTGTGAFVGLLGGIGTSALVHGLTTAEGKGGWLVPQSLLGQLHEFPSSMAQNFWLASFAFISCFALTMGLSFVTRRTKDNEQLKGLVYSLTPKLQEEGGSWILRPAVLGTILLAACVALNYIFW